MTITTPERWRRVQALCEAVETAPASEQLARLRALEPDESLRRETLELLQAMRDEAAYRLPRDRELELELPVPGSVAGVRLGERIGAGGFGVVHRGVRTVHGAQQPVAVKLFHADSTDVKTFRRFVREQNLLAALTHPDIVRLIDAGVTAAGQPYLIMELAEGQPLTVYCDERRLPLEQRLGLFLSICDAVQSAHRHLIVHLDLKPANILVSGDDGRIKLLDFGTAKLADPAAGFTRTEPLTPLYASPERLRGEPVSVACDVYSLGLILYELAAGAWPFRQPVTFLSVAQRASGEAELLPPSRVVTAETASRRGARLDRLRAELSGDLDAIALKAVADDAAERYSSVAELAEDLRRYLAGEPVRARPPRVAYRLGKFVRRNAWPVASVALLVVGLAAAAGYSAVQARAQLLAAERAETQNRFLTGLFTLAGTDSAARRDMTVRELLVLASERIAPALAADEAIAGDVEVTLAHGFISQDAFAEARPLLESAVERAVTSRDVAREAAARASLAYVAYVQNRTDTARSTAMSALELWERHPRRFTPEQAISTLSRAAATLSYVEPTHPAPRKYFEHCLEIAAAPTTVVDPPARAWCLRGLAIAYANVESRYDEADALLRDAVALQRADRSAAVELATTLQILGMVNRYRGRFADDESAQSEAYQILLQLKGAESLEALWQRSRWALSLVGTGRVDEARRVARQVLAGARETYPQRGSYLMWTPLVAAASAACVAPVESDCEALAAEALESLGPQPSEDDPRVHQARGLLGLAWVSQGRLEDALPLIEGSLAMESERRRTSPHTAAWREALAQHAVDRDP
jgi:serine/threonine-protein kinase